MKRIFPLSLLFAAGIQAADLKEPDAAANVTVPRWQPYDFVFKSTLAVPNPFAGASAARRRVVQPVHWEDHRKRFRGQRPREPHPPRRLGQCAPRAASQDALMEETLSLALL